MTGGWVGGRGCITDWFDSEIGIGCEAVTDPDQAPGADPNTDNRKQRVEIKSGVNGFGRSGDGPRLCIDLLKKENCKLFSDVRWLVKDFTKSAMVDAR